ncbi:MAG: type II toxin-antitoxin system VapC family toxin [Candidatus Bipolaricaulia bacterium]
MIYLLDTHALIWFLEGGRKLGARALKILRDDQQKLLIPSIVLAEAKYLAHKSKITLPFTEILEAVTDPRCTIYPLDLAVIEAMPPDLEIHDAILCGTALVCMDSWGEDVRVITKDEAIVQSGIVATTW